MEGVRAEGRAEILTSESRESLAGERGSNSTSRPPGSPGVAGAGVGLVPGADVGLGSVQSQRQPARAGSLETLFPNLPSPAPAERKTVESRTVVSERVS
ncbi:hypothetical protein GBF38_015821 [Nibea albiflora]|uniref:Uncharacterized protein n=1 Tax=Nibea albiflora TaxID=240163 RepID=A0ACB7ELS8_NIBAL|nr:hypothetical protein GBF38_015821 [Nibea albiflora]